MAGYNGSGVFSFSYSWQNDAANGISITASRMDTEFADATGGFNLAMTRDGQGAATAIIPFASGITIGGGATLSNYTQGTWTPRDASGAGLTLTTNRATYVRIGSMIMLDMTLSYPVTANGANAVIDGIPFLFANTIGVGGAFFIYDGLTAGALGFPVLNTGGFLITGINGTPIVNSTLSGATLRTQFMCFTV